MIIDDIVVLINDIGNLHHDFSSYFFHKRNNEVVFNLKKVRIDNILSENSYDEVFIELLDSYIEELSSWLIFLDTGSDSPKLETRFRGKNKESALNKLY